MKRLEVPEDILDWFWTMYRNLYVVIVINKYKSEQIYIQRGFMEGSPREYGSICGLSDPSDVIFGGNDGWYSDS